MNTHDGKELLAQDLERPVEPTTAPNIFTFATEIACNVLYDPEVFPYAQAPNTLDIPWEEHVNCSIDPALVIRQTDADLLSSEEECAYTPPSITSLKSVDDGSGADMGTSSRNQPVAVSCNTTIHDVLAQNVTETSAKVASEVKYLEIISMLENKLAAAEQRCNIATEQQTVNAMRIAELERKQRESQVNTAGPATNATSPQTESLRCLAPSFHSVAADQAFRTRVGLRKPEGSGSQGPPRALATSQQMASRPSQNKPLARRHRNGEQSRAGILNVVTATGAKTVISPMLNSIHPMNPHEKCPTQLVYNIVDQHREISITRAGSWVKRGGITVVSSKYKLRRFEPQFSDEFLAVEVNWPDGASVCTILVVYIPPCQSRYISLEREDDMWEELIALTLRIDSTRPLVVMGDFNTHLCDLPLNALVEGSGSKRACRRKLLPQYRQKSLQLPV
ncbi:hypothetical protein RvY_15616 [Ramazzottius varieornatus]|uniref:Endonuclease/exonuclease/phosphatase domain-containing protein n=1 Tax=Ramazzottius varieornatus TaxID=947166 RepID=A0A1D1VWQ3_RAMVA|nr:hypothetical protein RvY_15616 [Ramazzottius varieornatus]